MFEPYRFDVETAETKFSRVVSENSIALQHNHLPT
jgi:hypothetical protein